MRPKSVLAGIATVLGAVALIGGCVAVLNLGVDPEGDCGVDHVYDGARYLWPGDAARQPRGVLVIGEAERIACAKVIGHDAVYAVAGVSPDVAVVIDGYLLVRRGAKPPRQLLRAAERPIICTRPTTFKGTWQGSLQTTRNEGPEKDDDDAYLRPYRLEIDATGGDHAAFRQWQRLQVTVVITAETELTREDEHEAAYQLVPMLIAAHCDGDRFLADRVELRPDSSPGETGSINGRPDESTERNVSAFVHRIASSFGSKVWLATDWETATILIGVAAPLPQELEQLNGTTVAGLRVDLLGRRDGQRIRGLHPCGGQSPLRRQGQGLLLQHHERLNIHPGQHRPAEPDVRRYNHSPPDPAREPN